MISNREIDRAIVDQDIPGLEQLYKKTPAKAGPARS